MNKPRWPGEPGITDALEHQPQWLPSIAIATAVGSALVLLANVDPHVEGRYPTCPTLAIFGVYCPGCGSLRATHDLTQGDIVGAWQMNPLLVLALPYMVAAFYFFTRRQVKGTPEPFIPAWAIWTVGVLIVLFGVMRNFSMFSFLAPQ